MQLTIVGGSGSVPGPESPGVLLSGAGAVRGPRPSRSCSTSGRARSARSTATWIPPSCDAVASATCIPTTASTSAACTSPAATPPTAPWRRIPVYGPVGTAARLARAYEVERRLTSPGPRIAERFDYRVWAAEQRIGPFTRDHGPGRAPGRGVRDPGARENRAAGGSLVFSGDTGPTPVLADAGPRRRPAALRGRVPDRRGQPTRPAPDRAARPRRSPTRPASGCLVLTHIPPWHDPRAGAGRGPPHFAGRSSSPCPARAGPSADPKVARQCLSPP